MNIVIVKNATRNIKNIMNNVGIFIDSSTINDNVKE